MKSLRDLPTPVDSPLIVNWDVPDAEDAGNARDATTQHTKTHPIFQTRKIDQTQKIPMLGIYQPPSNTLKIDFQTHDNAGDVSP